MLLQLSSPSAGRQIFFFINPFKSHFLFKRNIMNNLYILSLHESSSGYTFFKSSKKSLQEPVVDRVNEIPIKKRQGAISEPSKKITACYLDFTKRVPQKIQVKVISSPIVCSTSFSFGFSTHCVEKQIFLQALILKDDVMGALKKPKGDAKTNQVVAYEVLTQCDQTKFRIV